jgi:hypothetical protein
MRAVAADALGAGVHDHGGDLADCPSMATRAIFGSEGRERAAVVRLRLIAATGEGVTVRAVGAGSDAKALLSQTRSVRDARLILMAGRTANRPYGTHGSGVHLVAAVAGDVLLDHVHTMTRDAPIRAPIRRHVNTSAGRASGAARRWLRRASHKRCPKAGREQAKEGGEPRRIVHCLTHLRAPGSRAFVSWIARRDLRAETNCGASALLADVQTERVA